MAPSPLTDSTVAQAKTSKQKHVSTTTQANPTMTSSENSKRQKRSRRGARKKPRLSSPTPTSASSPLALPDGCQTADPLTKLPLELLGEILVGTRSTRDVLAVARCNKHLWKTLKGSPAAFIWKRTRQVAAPQDMPNPPSGGVISEPAYAMMVFDGGICEFCKKYTKETYSSFALRLRICINERCRRARVTPATQGFHLFQRKNIDKDILERTPVIEADLTNFDDDSSVNKQYWPHAKLWCRTRDLVKSLRDHKTGRGEAVVNETLEEFQRQHQEIVKKNREWIGFCVALHKWYDAYRTEYATIKRSNDQLIRDIAKQKGYALGDLLSSTTFGPLHRTRIRCLEHLTINDFDSLVPKVKQELAALAEKRKRSERDASYRTVRGAIEGHYRQLQSETPKLIMPPFAIFRRLPTLASLLTLTDGDTGKSIQEILKKDGVRDVIKGELEKWETEARKQVAGLFAHLDWTPEREGALHPCDRVTTWLLCIDCRDQAVQYEREIEPLTFAQACAHECRVHEGDRRKKAEPWDISKFVKDDKANAVFKKLLEIFELDEATTGRAELDAKFGTKRMKCLSCKSWSMLALNDVTGHSHRHDDMDIAPLGDNEIEEKLADSIESGSAQKLINRSVGQRETKDCGCMHCLSNMALTSPEMHFQEWITRLPKMSVNGLRSHLKAKHGFVALRDEDIFKFSMA